MLGREATDKEVEQYLKLLMSGSSVREMRKGIVLSPECEKAITEVYEEIRRRPPTPKELKHVRSEMLEGHGLDDLRARLGRK